MLNDGFKYIPGFGKSYMINRIGRVKSCARYDYIGRLLLSKEMRLVNHSAGYKTLYLRRDNSYVHCYIHRLVMLTFIGVSSLQVNHKDGDKQNNDLRNLEYVTPKENIQHAIKNGLINNSGANNYQAKLDNQDVELIRTLNIKPIKLAKIFGVSRQTVCDIQKFRTWKRGNK